MHVMSYLREYLFRDEQARQPVRTLSGGERNRLLLAKALAAPSNLLVLDEPTNDLDLETLDVLEEMLADYAGTILLASHDRDFLDRVVNAVIVPEGDGRWTEYAGGYTDMLSQRGRDFSPTGAKSDKSVPATKTAPGIAEPSAPTKPQARRRLSFNDKHALETLPKAMAALQAKVQTLGAKLEDDSLYGRDRKAFDAASAALATAQSELAEAEQKWLELEILREEIEGK